MIALLGLEAIGDDARERLAVAFAQRRYQDAGRYLALPGRPWVARITGRDGRFGLARSFLRPQRDYSRAEGSGTRGIVLWYDLVEGEVYEVHELVSWTRDRRYFCRAEHGKVVEITREEVERCL